MGKNKKQYVTNQTENAPVVTENVMPVTEEPAQSVELNNVMIDPSLALKEAPDDIEKNADIIGVGPKQVDAQKYEYKDYTKKSFFRTTFGKLLKGVLKLLTDPFMWVYYAVRNLLITVGMDTPTKQAYFKEMSERAATLREQSTRETAEVANKKMAIINDKSLKTNEQIEKLATLCHTTGCTFYIVLEDKSAIQFSKNEKSVEIRFSDPPRQAKGKNYLSYVFGSPIGNIEYRTTGELINSKKPQTVNINTVLARIDERGGINTKVDTLLQNAQVVTINDFTSKRTNVQVEKPAVENTRNNREENKKAPEQQIEKQPERTQKETKEQKVQQEPKTNEPVMSDSKQKNEPEITKSEKIIEVSNKTNEIVENKEQIQQPITKTETVKKQIYEVTQEPAKSTRTVQNKPTKSNQKHDKDFVIGD